MNNYLEKNTGLDSELAFLSIYAFSGALTHQCNTEEAIVGYLLCASSLNTYLHEEEEEDIEEVSDTQPCPPLFIGEGSVLVDRKSVV